MPPARRPESLRGRVFRKRDVIAAGVLTPSELRSSAWRRVYRGVYADAELPDTFGLRIAGAALLVPPGAVFSGRTAAFLHGATDLVETRSPVEVSVPPTVRYGPVTGLRIRHVGVPGGDCAVISGRPCTTGLRTALDVARAEPLLEAVVALDVLLAKAVVGRSELREVAAGLTGRGARQVQRAVELTDHRAESPPESRLRVLLTLAGLRPEPQFVVRKGGVFVARVDLAYPEQRVAIEYDGGWHAEPGQFAKDRRRLNRLVAAGWTVLHVTAADLRDPDLLIARVRALLAERNFGESAR
jgi:very-short-patch-repair endonuclease